MQNKMIYKDKIQWKTFTNVIYGENPVRKLEMPCWQNLIFQLENFYFPTEKLFFSSWALFSSFLNVFLRHFGFFSTIFYSFLPTK